MRKTTEKIGYKYFYFILLVVGLIITNQAIIQYSLNTQKEDAKTINLSGRQRMLSQRISKVVLFINYNRNTIDSKYNLDSLNHLSNQWEEVNETLIENNKTEQNAEIESLLKTNTPRLKSIVAACRQLMRNPSNDIIENTIKVIRENELPYLITMEKTASTYQKNAENKVNNLKIIELILSIISAGILICTFFTYVLPVIKELIKTGENLTEANQRLMFSEGEIRRNLEALKALNTEIGIKDHNNRIFIEQAPGAIAMVDNEMKYLAASKKWRSDYGLEGKEILGKSHYEIFPEIGDDWKKIHQDCLAGAVNICDEAPFTRTDGHTQWLSWEVKPWYTTENKIGGVIMYTNDITKVKETQIEKLKLQTILDRTNEVARIGAWEVDLINQKVIWSKITREIHEAEPDFEPDLATGINFYKEGKSREAIQKAVNEAIESGTPWDVELEIITAKNRFVWVRSIGQAEIVDGKCIRLYGVFHDITEIVNSKNGLESLAKQLTNQNNQLASFAHITSHNLRSPVSNLNSLLYFYKNSESQEDKDGLFEKFEIVIHHLSSTLNTLVDTLKIKEDNEQLVEELSFENILDKTEEILAGQIIESKALLTNDFTKSPKINYNRTYLESIFLNLISNALKYKSQERFLNLHLETTINQEGKTVLTVTDNGLGIDMKRHGNMLFGLNKTFHRHAEAKGIGLYLTKTQIESMGGTITAESEINKGTSFIVQF